MDQTNLKDAQLYIEQNAEQLLNDWLDLIRIPSVTLCAQEVERCCEYIIAKMQELGIDVVKHPVKPNPVIEGRLGNAPDKKTVLIYAHYDVKPEGDLSAWLSPPFDPTLRDGKIYARGSADNKSPLMAHLKAVEFYLRSGKEIPVNLIFIFEGAEEEGSLGLEEFLGKNKNRLHADMVFFSDGPKDPSGLPIIALGAKGVLSVTLQVRTMNKNVHSRYAPVLPSAAWRLVELLNKLKCGDTIMIPGFYDEIIPPSARELEILEKMPSSEHELEHIYDTKVTTYGRGFYDRLNNSPTFNINSLESGAAGIIPATATATLDIRLVAGQKPEDILKKLQDYVVHLGYDDVEVIGNGGVEPSKTDISTPFLPVVEQATHDIYGEYVIYPCRPSTAPDYLWTNVLELPAIQVRWSDPDSDNHAPNEHLSIKEYYDGIALTIHILSCIAKM